MELLVIYIDFQHMYVRYVILKAFLEDAYRSHEICPLLNKTLVLKMNNLFL